MASQGLKDKYIIWKNLGETPLEALTRLSDELDIPKDVPLTYAGRLDPAAEGFLIILVGEECKKKENYTKLPKTYLAEILVGVSTDSFDLLGIPKTSGVGTVFLPAKPRSSVLSLEQSSAAKTMPTPLAIARDYLDSILGKHMQEYPKYSSPKIAGSKLTEHEVELISYEDLSSEDVLSEDVLVRVGEITASVTGDFRQAEIAQSWAEMNLPEKMQLITVTLNVGSGFYVRQFADDLGKTIGSGACLYSLIRTGIGEHKSADF